MLGVLIQLVVSWLLLKFFEKKNLSVLGFKPTKARLLHFFFGFAAAAICFTLYCLTITKLVNSYWTINPNFTAKDFASSAYWTLNSVLFEELIFRGALFYILIQKTNIKTACLISAVAFGIYHWFSFSVFGNPVQMTYVFFTTGLWGFMYGLSFAKTKSLYLPIGLHLGWNLFSIVIFSQGPLGQQWLVRNGSEEQLDGLPSLAMAVFQIFFLPGIVYLFLRRYERVQVRAHNS